MHAAARGRKRARCRGRPSRRRTKERLLSPRMSLPGANSPSVARRGTVNSDPEQTRPPAHSLPKSEGFRSMVTVADVLRTGRFPQRRAQRGARRLRPREMPQVATPMRTVGGLITPALVIASLRSGLARNFSIVPMSG